MLSRVADALYWMGRYLERAENVTRLLLVTEDLTAEIRGLHEQLAAQEWRDLLAIYPGADLTPRGGATGAARNGQPPSLPYLAAFLVDEANPYSVGFSLRKARDNARSVREALTVEVFLNLNEAYRALSGRTRRELRDLPGMRTTLVATHKDLLGIVGAIDSTLSRDQGWLFAKLGEALERAFRTAFILRAKLPSLLAREKRIDLELHYTRWRGLLRGVSSLENHRQAHGARLEPRDVIRFLLFDPHAPRSLRHGAAAVQGHLGRIAAAAEPTPPERIVGKLLARLAYETDDVLQRAEVVPFLDHVLGELTKTHDAIAAQYFTT
jgi:uncharacterized alpha-E superfamily protein